MKRSKTPSRTLRKKVDQVRDRNLVGAPSRGSAGLPVDNTAAMSEILSARRDLTKYLQKVMNDTKVPDRRRDEMAFCLSKIVATALPKMTTTGALRTGRAPPKGERKPAKPRVSTYVSKKKQADIVSKTAPAGSSWDGLVNGSGVHAADGDDEDEE